MRAGFLDDEAVRALKQCAATLKRLRLDKNSKVTSEAIMDIIEWCPLLTFLSINDTQCDERVLEKVLDMPQRHMIIVCCDAKIDLAKFLVNKQDYKKKFLFTAEKKSFFDFCMRNLKFGVNVAPDEEATPDFMELVSDDSDEDSPAELDGDMRNFYRVRYFGGRPEGNIIFQDDDDGDDDDEDNGDMDDDDEEGDDDEVDIGDDDDDEDDEDDEENGVNDDESSEGEPCNQM